MEEGFLGRVSGVAESGRASLLVVGAAEDAADPAFSLTKINSEYSRCILEEEEKARRGRARSPFPRSILKSRQNQLSMLPTVLCAARRGSRDSTGLVLTQVRKRQAHSVLA